MAMTPSARLYLRVPILVAALCLVVSLVLPGTGLTGNAQAQADRGAIPSLELASDNPGQLTISWQAPESPPTDYRIRWAKSDLSWLPWDGVNEAERGNEESLAGVTSLTLDNLTPGDTYKVQMRSRYYNSDRTVHESSGPWTGVRTQRVKDHPPAAPTGLTASELAHESVTLTWNDPQDASITGHRVLRGSDANSLSTIQADTGSASTSYSDSTVAAETTYHYAVVAMSQDGAGEQSGTLSVTTPAMAQAQHGTIPSVSLASDNPGQLTITWEAPEDPPTDYRIRWAKAGLSWLSWNGVNEAERGNEESLAGATSLALDNLTPGDTYKVQMRSRYYNADRTVHESSGPWTGVLTRRVKDHPPAAPADLSASQVAHESVTLTWNDPQDAGITGYRVLRGSDANSLSTIQADTGSSGTFYTDSTVEAETTYHYAVVAMSQDGAGEQSGTLRVTTPADPKSKDPTPQPPPRVGPRQSQTITTFISNTGQTMPSTSSNTIATAFTTGAGTYTLSSVGIYIGTQTGTPTPLVRIYEDDSGNPGSTPVATMTNPTLTDDAVNTFTAPPNTTLSGSTTYWLVTTNSAVTNGTGFRVSRVSTDIPDAGAAAGWSIGGARSKSDISNASWTTSGHRHRFQIRGTSTAVTLFSNLGQALADHARLGTTSDLAQPFKIGSYAVSLTSIELSLRSETTGTVPPTVTLHSGSATGTKVADLTGPSALTAGMTDTYTFTPSGTVRLKPSTIYWVVAEGGSDDIDWTTTTSDDEDAIAVAGYNSESRIHTSTGTFTTSTSFLRLRVSGEPIANAPHVGAPSITAPDVLYPSVVIEADFSGITDANGVSSIADTVFYRWQRFSADLLTLEGRVGTDATYTLTEADVGKRLKVAVLFTDDDGYDERSQNSAASAVVVAANTPARGAPRINGTAQLGLTLRVSTSGISDADGLLNVGPSYSYQWLADDTALEGATSSTYTPQLSDIGKVIKVRVTFNDDSGYEESLTSEGTAAVIVG